MTIELEREPMALNEYGRQKTYRTGYRKDIIGDTIFILQKEKDGGCVEIYSYPQNSITWGILLRYVRILEKQGYKKGRRL